MSIISKHMYNILANTKWFWCGLYNVYTLILYTYTHKNESFINARNFSFRVLKFITHFVLAFEIQLNLYANTLHNKFK